MAADQFRDRRGRFASRKKITTNPEKHQAEIDHSYVQNVWTEEECCQTVDESWMAGRRVVEFAVLVEGLKYCKSCRLGPIPLTSENIVGELKKGLGGYLYVKCLIADCGSVNCIPYGKIVKGSKQGSSTFAVNTKLGTGRFCFLMYLDFCLNI